ncbi:hypothetical protein ISS07_00795 [Candidatus Woesearchaeota archaeon]|nr:hypothetical protein [Candidatus Woesearchaeota archaeon]
MKKGLKFTKSQLEELYLNKKLSLSQIGKLFDCHQVNILYWLKKFGIRRRPAYREYVHISKEDLRRLYWKKGLKTQEIAYMYGLKNGRSVLKKMKKYGINSKTVSEATTKKMKNSFNGDFAEKAFLLGLRAGDFHAKRVRKCIRVQSTTTHLAQIDLLKNSFEKYGVICKYLSKHHARCDEWFIYVDLDKSFEFLLRKPEQVSNWILEKERYFWEFLAAYMDCEGNWHLSRSHDIHTRLTFRIRSGDKEILEDCSKKLASFGYNPIFCLDTKKGKKGPNRFLRKDMYGIIINKKKEVIRLCNQLIPFSKHSEKVRKMKLMIAHGDKNYSAISKKWNDLKEQIKGEILVNV